MAFVLFLVMSLTLVIKIHDPVLQSLFCLQQHIKLMSGSKILPCYRLSLITPCPFPALCFFFPVPFSLVCQCYYFTDNTEWPSKASMCQVTLFWTIAFPLRGPERISTYPSSRTWGLLSVTDLLWCQQSSTSQGLFLLESPLPRRLPSWAVYL